MELETMKVAVLGAANFVGQPLSLLLKLNGKINELALFDKKGGYGVCADLSHINRNCVVSGYEKEEELSKCLKGSDVVVICANSVGDYKEISDEEELFAKNNVEVKKLARKIIEFSSNAVVVMLSEPVDYLVPMVSEMFSKRRLSSKVYGISTLHLVRSEVFLRELLHKKGITDRDEELRSSLRVLGGSCGRSIVPVIVNSGLKELLSCEEYFAFVEHVQHGDEEVVAAKGGRGSATLSMAYAGNRFVSKLVDEMGSGGVGAGAGAGAGESAYVRVNKELLSRSGAAAQWLAGVEYFALPMSVDAAGVAVSVDESFLAGLGADEMRLLAGAAEAVKHAASKAENHVRGPRL